jgi:hypothetical protein
MYLSMEMRLKSWSMYSHFFEVSQWVPKIMFPQSQASHHLNRSQNTNNALLPSL